jgi:hypothetical protein
MAVTDFANHAAAVAAGFMRVQGRSPGSGIYFSRYEKPMAGEPGTSGSLFTAEGNSSVDQATADTNALTALNAALRHHYGGAPGRASGDANSNGSRGGSMTPYVH